MTAVKTWGDAYARRVSLGLVHRLLNPRLKTCSAVGFEKESQGEWAKQRCKCASGKAVALAGRSVGDGQRGPPNRVKWPSPTGPLIIFQLRHGKRPPYGTAAFQSRVTSWVVGLGHILQPSSRAGSRYGPATIACIGRIQR